MIPYTELCALADKYGTDKRPEPKGHGYTHFYHELFDGRRSVIRRVLEIGIDVGASLRMWEEYFPNATIYALDSDPARLINEGRIVSFQCDQSVVESLRSAKSMLGGGFDFILDDGSHDPGHQALSVTELFPLLGYRGIYIVEDACHPDAVLEQLPLYLQSKCEIKEFDISRDPYSKLMVFHV